MTILEIDEHNCFATYEKDFVSSDLTAFERKKFELIFFSSIPTIGKRVLKGKPGTEDCYTDNRVSDRVQNFTGTVHRDYYEKAIEILEKHRLKYRRLSFAGFELYNAAMRFTENISESLVIYRSELFFHIMHIENSTPLFSTSFPAKELYIEEFLKTFFDAGIDHILYISRSDNMPSMINEFTGKKSIQTGNFALLKMLL